MTKSEKLKPENCQKDCAGPDCEGCDRRQPKTKSQELLEEVKEFLDGFKKLSFMKDKGYIAQTLFDLMNLYHSELRKELMGEVNKIVKEYFYRMDNLGHVGMSVNGIRAEFESKLKKLEVKG